MNDAGIFGDETVCDLAAVLYEELSVFFTKPFFYNSYKLTYLFTNVSELCETLKISAFLVRIA